MFTLYPLFIAQILTFQEAEELTLENSPQLQIQADEIGRKIGNQIQSKLLPNPVFSYTLENKNGGKEKKEEYDLSQAIITGGKIHYRTMASSHAVTEAEEELEFIRIKVLNRLKKQFIQIAGLQELLNIAEEKGANGKAIVKNLEEKIQQGKGSPIHLQKLKIQLSSALFSQEKLRGDLQEAKEVLAMEWGGSYPDFEAVSFDLYHLNCPYTSPERGLTEHPLLMQWEFRRRGLEQYVRYQKALAIPDVLFSIGYRNEPHKHGFAFSLSVPLPFFDRNQGNILKAEFDEQSAITEQSAIQTRLHTQLRMAIKQTTRNFKEALYLKDILKSAETAHELSMEGYKEGKYGLIDVLETQQAVLETKEQYVNALVRTHVSQVDIDYLIPPEIGEEIP